MIYKKATPLVGKELDPLQSRFVHLSSCTESSTMFVVRQEHIANLPGVAHAVYGDHKWWRALMWYNKIVDPFNEVIPGVVLKVPPKALLAEFISERHYRKEGLK